VQHLNEGGAVITPHQALFVLYKEFICKTADDSPE
jgi:hypothetical protein